MKKGNIFNAERDNHGKGLKLNDLAKKLSISTYLIVAVDSENGIGKNGRIPWHLKGDMQFFKKMTTKTKNPSKKNMVIMGRKTWESIPEKFRPLPGRKNIVLTRHVITDVAPNENGETERYGDENSEDISLKVNHKFLRAAEPIFVNSLKKAIQSADDTIETIFIIGGAQVFREALETLDITGIYLTKIHKKFDCDTYLPEIPKKFQKTHTLFSKEENGIHYACEIITEFPNHS